VVARQVKNTRKPRKRTFRSVSHFFPGDQIEQIVRAADADVLVGNWPDLVVYHWTEWRLPRTLIENLSWESQAIIYN